MRTFNAAPENDTLAPDLAASDRHIVPPRTSVELAERMGMFDGPDGKLKSDPGTWNLAATRDAGQFAEATIEIAGKSTDHVPIESGSSIDALPYLPDLLSRGAAIRDLPGSGNASIGRVAPDDPLTAPVEYSMLTDINPRPGSATLVSFNATGEWQDTVGFRLALDELPAGETDARPQWNPGARVLTVYLAKGYTAVVPLSSYMT